MFVFQSIHPSVHPSIHHRFIYLSFCVYLFIVCPSVWTDGWMNRFDRFIESICPSIHLSIRPSVHPSVRPPSVSIYSSSLQTDGWINRLLHSSICPSIHLSRRTVYVHPFVLPSVHHLHLQVHIYIQFLYKHRPVTISFKSSTR